MLLRSFALAIAIWAQCAVSMATTVTSHYSSQGGNNWSVEFTVLNDGSLAEVGGFTIYFSEANFAALSLDGAPAIWDSLVIQPDLGLPAAGFLDAFAIDAVDRLGNGESIGGFHVGFTFLGIGTPGSLSFDIVDSNFQVVESGFTVVPGGPVISVPEPATLGLFGLGLVAALASRRSRAPSPPLETRN